MKKILITGASGYIGSQLVKRLRVADEELSIMATDIKPSYFGKGRNEVRFRAGDLTTDEVADLILEYKPDVVAHLAAIVAPTKEMTREWIYSVEVEGFNRVLDACVEAGVRKFINTSSGAAYGYYEDNPESLVEEDAIRGNEEFAYSWHKRLNEEKMAEYRNAHPAMKQLIFRVGTVMGKNTRNDITNLFQKPRIAGIRGTDSPWVIIWDEDLIACLVKGCLEDVSGIYNLSGDGVVTMREMAGIINKRFIPLPAGLVRFALSVAKPLKLSRYGPEQVKFIQYRPVLSNAKMKSEFGYEPQKSSKEAFIYYAEQNGLT